YFVDFDHLEKYGKPVNGAVYRKLPHGPYPKDAEKIVKRMGKKGLLAEVEVARGKFTQHRLITFDAKFDATLFNGAELQTLEKVASDWADETAAQIEAATHAEAPWASTQDGKVIDYELAEYRK